MKALVPDTSCILVDVGAMRRAPWPRLLNAAGPGLNFRLEMPLADAEAFLEDKDHDATGKHIAASK